VVNGIDIHQLNLRPFRSLKNLVENPLKLFLVLVENKIKFKKKKIII
jgi:hypothetical protein